MRAYDTKPSPQGGLNRYVVILRTNVDLGRSPSGDEVGTHVVWADDPYQAATTAQIVAQHLVGLQVRRTIGVQELPIELPPDPESR